MKRKLKSRHSRLKTKLGLPDLEQAKIAVIVSLRSFESQRSYRHSIDEFVACIAPHRDCRLTKRSFSVIGFISKIAIWLQGRSTSGWQRSDDLPMKQQIPDC
jgi:hypothetical protein